jgi:cell division septum initiation protein DivIVA
MRKQENEYLRLYYIRLRLAAVLNILDITKIVSLFFNKSELTYKKSFRQANLKSLLFGLNVRCNRLLEEALYHAEAIKSEDKELQNTSDKLIKIISSKRHELLQSQQLLEKRLIEDALDKLAKAKDGLDELVQILDVQLKKRLA